MFYLNIIFALFLSLSYAVITVSPDGTQDFTTIQAAIDHVTANPADLEIDVYPGTYQENLLIEADMIIRSVGDADNTIIDGSLGSRSLGSTIVIRPESNSTHKPVVEIDGFSIINGKGTDVVNKTITLADGSHPEEKVGGGLFVYVNSPKINNSQFLGNGDNSTDKGGAIFGVSSSDGIDFPDRPYQDHPDLEPATGTLDFSNNTFLGNDAIQGHSIYILGDDYDEVKMVGDYLDVFSTVYNSVTEYWVNSDSEIDYSNASGEVEAIYTDVWVDPVNGVDEGNTTGDESNPFLTINYALGMIYPTGDNSVTINLTGGTETDPDIFAPSTTGEVFPIIMTSNVNLIGQGEEITILDAEGSIDNPVRVITMENCENNMISEITIRGGWKADYGLGLVTGGGMYLFFSNPTLTNVTISENTAYVAGGMYLSYSNPIFVNVTIVDNISLVSAGGMYLSYSNPTLTNVLISGNTATSNSTGGGGMFLENSNPILSDVTISGNTAYYGGGMILEYSNPRLTNVLISENTALFASGGIQIGNSNPVLRNVVITGNTANGECDCGMSPEGYGGGITVVGESYPTFINVTITGNMATFYGGGMYISNMNSATVFTNGIIWNNSPESIYVTNATPPIINYSILEGGITPSWVELEGEGIIDTDPLFTDPENGDFTPLASECINSGDPNLWYRDIDGTRADMGSTGGPFFHNNFTEYDFGEVGNFGSYTLFTLYNYRETPITIDSVYFSNNTFSTSTFFPVIIDPFQTGVITIDCLPAEFGLIEDDMVIYSQDMEDGISISLSAIVIEGNILNGHLSGTIPSGTFRIVGDISVESGDNLILSAGSEFLFDGEYEFRVDGILVAEGTEADSIIFDNFGDENWRGFTLNNQTEETIFNYVRISGAEKENGGGMFLEYSNPILTDVIITGNTSSEELSDGSRGGGLYLLYSNPTMTNVVISENIDLADDLSLSHNGGGGMYLRYSNPTMTNVIISGNTSEFRGGGIYILESTPILTDATINDNTAESYGGGAYILESTLTLTDVTINNNIAGDFGSGGGICLITSTSTLTNVTISGNEAPGGGGIYLTDAQAPSTFTNITISQNTAHVGGGMYIGSYSNPTLSNMIINGNTAAAYGGGMYITGNSNPIMEDVMITDNLSQQRGGGIFVEFISELTQLNRLLISDNYSIGNGGGIFVSWDCTINLQHSTIANNMVGPGDVSGAGIYAHVSTINLINSIIFFNRREGDSNINYNLNGYTEEVFDEYNISYSDIEGDDNWVAEGIGNISIDPEFIDFGNADYLLQENSPCIDAGTSFFVWEGDTLLDMSPEDYSGSAPDMGAFEWYPEEPDYQPGDVTQDGAVNVQDIVLVIAFILGNDTPDYNEFPLADLNTDGQLNVLDVVILVEMILNG